MSNINTYTPPRMVKEKKQKHVSKISNLEKKWASKILARAENLKTEQDLKSKISIEKAAKPKELKTFFV